MSADNSELTLHFLVGQ